MTRQSAIRWGVARGIFSNEAGLGSAAVTAACADTEDPVRQGLISMTGVFFDTTVICTVTGLAICCSGVLGTADGAGAPLTGAALTIRAFETVLGLWAGWLISISLGLFAFTSILAAPFWRTRRRYICWATPSGCPAGAVRPGGLGGSCTPYGNRTSAGGPGQCADGSAESCLSGATFRRNCRGMWKNKALKL